MEKNGGSLTVSSALCRVPEYAAPKYASLAYELCGAKAHWKPTNQVQEKL